MAYEIPEIGVGKPLKVIEQMQGQTYVVDGSGYTAQRIFHVYNAKGTYDAKENVGIEYGDYYDDEIINEGKDPNDPENLPILWNLRAVRISIEVGSTEYLHIVTIDYELKYGKFELPSIPEAGDETWRFEPSGDTVNVKLSNTQTKYGALSVDYKKAIGVNAEGEVSGVDLPDNSEILYVKVWVKTEDFAISYINQIRGALNKINNQTFYGVEEGCALFSSWRQLSNNEWYIELEFEFRIRPKLLEAQLPTYNNKDGSTYTITGGKEGWQYLWEQNIKATDPTTKVTTYYTRGVYVEDLFEKVDLANLLEISGDLGVNAEPPGEPVG